MKNRIGIFTGFALGMLLAFLGIAIVSHLHPEEDFAGITIFTLLLSGLLLSVIGSILQSFINKKKIQN